MLMCSQDKTSWAAPRKWQLLQPVWKCWKTHYTPHTQHTGRKYGSCYFFPPFLRLITRGLCLSLRREVESGAFLRNCHFVLLGSPRSTALSLWQGGLQGGRTLPGQNQKGSATLVAVHSAPHASAPVVQASHRWQLQRKMTSGDRREELQCFTCPPYTSESKRPHPGWPRRHLRQEWLRPHRGGLQETLPVPVKSVSPVKHHSGEEVPCGGSCQNIWEKLRAR